MSVLDQRARSHAAARADINLDAFLDPVLDIVRREMWEWFEENRDMQLLRVRKWFFSFSVRVHHLRPLFEILFGPSPSGSGE